MKKLVACSRKIRVVQITAVAVILAVFSDRDLKAATIAVSRTDAGCTNVINPWNPNCVTQANFLRAELVVSVHIVSPGSNTDIIRSTDGLDNCTQTSPHSITSPSHTYIETNSVTTTTSSSIGSAGDDLLKAQLSSSLGITDGSTVTIVTSPQTVEVAACSKMEVRVSVQKNVGKKAKATGQYFCIYEVVYAQGQCALPVGSLISEATASGEMSSTLNVWTGGSNTAIVDGTCPEPRPCQCE